jgi:hypothetical protein
MLCCFARTEYGVGSSCNRVKALLALNIAAASASPVSLLSFDGLSVSKLSPKLAKEHEESFKSKWDDWELVLMRPPFFGSAAIDTGLWTESKLCHCLKLSKVLVCQWMESILHQLASTCPQERVRQFQAGCQGSNLPCQPIAKRKNS